MEEELDDQLKKSKEQLQEETEQRRKLAATVEELGSQAEATEKQVMVALVQLPLPVTSWPYSELSRLSGERPWVAV
jgi:hypothetical protein